MITAGPYPPISIDLGKDEPGMVLQYGDIERGYIVWRDYTVDGEVVKSLVDIEKLPAGRYRVRQIFDLCFGAISGLWYAASLDRQGRC